MKGAPKRKHKYPTDTETGVRTLPQIRSLPSGQLSDEEFVKEFFDRFEAKAMIMVYYDKDDHFESFGRLRMGASAMNYYRKLVGKLDDAYNEINLEFKQQEDK